MSNPMFQPFFIHPNQKKRPFSRRRANVEEGFGPVIDIRSRPPNSAIGNGECVVTTHGDSSIAHSTRSKRARHDASSSSQQVILEQVPADQKDFYRDRKIEQDANESTVEVEINVEDDTTDAETVPIYSRDSPSLPHHSSSSSGNDGILSPGKTLVHVNNAPGDSMKTFNPENCYDLEELRRQLLISYEKIHHQEQLISNYQRTKHENIQLRNELNRAENRVAQVEGIVIDRNMRLKRLLSENVYLSAKIKQIQSEFGIDAVREIFNRED